MGHECPGHDIKLRPPSTRRGKGKTPLRDQRAHAQGECPGRRDKERRKRRKARMAEGKREKAETAGKLGTSLRSR